MVDPNEGQKLWDGAASAANQKLPKILEDIEAAARAVVHGGLQ
jgi:hypothetical protein